MRVMASRVWPLPSAKVYGGQYSGNISIDTAPPCRY